MFNSTTMENWMKNHPARDIAIISGIIVVSTPIIILQFLPRRLPPTILSALVGLAVGTLLGDIFLHALPFSLNSGYSDGTHSHHDISADQSGNSGPGTQSSLFSVLVGITSFMLMDRFLKVISADKNAHQHGFESDELEYHGDTSKVLQSATSKRAKQTTHKRHHRSEAPISHKSRSDKDHNISKSPISTGYLKLFANIAHTFTDGLTLGTIQYTNRTIAMTTTMAILLHEIPHKIGDHAILINSGTSWSNSLKLQILTAIGTLTGVAVGIALNEIETDQASVKGLMSFIQAQITPFTLGGLIYTAMSNMLPEMMETEDLSLFAVQVIFMTIGYTFVH